MDDEEFVLHCIKQAKEAVGRAEDVAANHRRKPTKLYVAVSIMEYAALTAINAATRALESRNAFEREMVDQMKAAAVLSKMCHEYEMALVAHGVVEAEVVQ